MNESPVRRPGVVRREEWRWVIGVAVLALVLTSLPYLVGWLSSSGNWRFGGFLIAIEDENSYIAKMSLGAQGAWLFHLLYTPEPHQPGLFFLFYLLLGKLGAPLARLGLLPLPEAMVLTFHLARLASGLALLSAAYRFAASFTGRLAVRRVALVLVAFTGGLGWLLAALGLGNWIGGAPVDFMLPEAFGFLAMLTLPHVALGEACLLWGITAWWESLDTAHRQQGRLLLAAGCWLVMALIVPFYMAVVCAVAGTALLIWLMRVRHGLDIGAIAGTVLATVPGGLMLVYTTLFTATNPVFGGWYAQNWLPSPPPAHYLAVFGLLLALAGLGSIRAMRDRLGRGWLLLAWVAIAPLLAYAPVTIQRRLVVGVQAPLAVLAAMGIGIVAGPFFSRCRRLWQGWHGSRRQVSRGGLDGSSRSIRRWATALSILLLLPSPAMLLVGGGMAALRPAPPIFHSAAEVAALDWLGNYAAYDAVVLSDYRTGNYLPARAGVRAFMGLGPETIDLEAKRAEAAQFFDARTVRSEREALLRRYSVAYVLVGPETCAPDHCDFAGLPVLARVYDRDGYQIYEVRSTSGPDNP